MNFNMIPYFFPVRANNLKFRELDGVEYAYYDTGVENLYGYIRFQPGTRKKRSKTKHFELVIGVNEIIFVLSNYSYFTVTVLAKYIGCYESGYQRQGDHFGEWRHDDCSKR